jgi:hypothetical protein
MTDDVALDSEVVLDPAVAEVAEPEKTLPISRVEELVKKAKLKGRDSMQNELDALKAENAALKTSAGSMGGMALPIDKEALKQEVLNEFRQQMEADKEQRAHEEMDKEAKRLAQTYHGRMSAGKDTYEDFDEVMADFDPAAFPNLVYLASQVDNTPDVMYELMQNPGKWSTVAVLADRDPRAAQSMINKISASIKANQQAKIEEKEVPQPLGRLSSSPTGQDKGTPSSVKDFKALYRG